MKTFSIRRTIQICCVLLLAGGCTPTSGSDISPTPRAETPTISIPAIATATSTLTNEPAIFPESTPAGPAGYRLSYQFDVRIDYGARQIEVDQLTTVNELPSGITNIIMVVEPNRYPNGFSLTSLTVNKNVIENYDLGTNELQFDLPAAGDQSGPIQIRLSYSLQLPVIPPPSDLYKPQPYGYTDRQLNLVDWFPFVPPLDAQTSGWFIRRMFLARRWCTRWLILWCSLN